MLPTSFAFTSKNAIPVILETKHMNNISISLIIVFIYQQKNSSFIFFSVLPLTQNTNPKNASDERMFAAPKSPARARAKTQPVDTPTIKKIIAIKRLIACAIARISIPRIDHPTPSILNANRISQPNPSLIFSAIVYFSF